MMEEFEERKEQHNERGNALGQAGEEGRSRFSYSAAEMDLFKMMFIRLLMFICFEHLCYWIGIILILCRSSVCEMVTTMATSWAATAPTLEEEDMKIEARHIDSRAKGEIREKREDREEMRANNKVLKILQMEEREMRTRNSRERNQDDKRNIEVEISLEKREDKDTGGQEARALGEQEKVEFLSPNKDNKGQEGRRNFRKVGGLEEQRGHQADLVGDGWGNQEKGLWQSNIEGSFSDKETKKEGWSSQNGQQYYGPGSFTETDEIWWEGKKESKSTEETSFRGNTKDSRRTSAEKREERQNKISDQPTHLDKQTSTEELCGVFSQVERRKFGDDERLKVGRDRGEVLQKWEEFTRQENTRPDNNEDKEDKEDKEWNTRTDSNWEGQEKALHSWQMISSLKESFRKKEENSDRTTDTNALSKKRDYIII